MSSLTKTNKVAIVTGSSERHRACDCGALVQDGATVIVNYGKSADKAKKVVVGIEAKGGKSIAIQADMSQVIDVGRLIKDTMKTFDQLDILVNNASWLPRGSR